MSRSAMNLTSSTLTAIVFVATWTSSAQGQPSEEPYYQQQVIEIHPVAPAAPGRQHLDREQPPCSSCAPAVIIRTTTPRASVASVDSGPHVSLDANAGYGGYWFLMREGVSGPVFSGSLSILFGAGHSRGGLRLHGFYSKASGEMDHLFDSPEPTETWLAGGSASAIGEYKGLWGSVGLGVVHVSSTTGDPEPWTNYSDGSESYTLPEIAMAAGYNLPLGRHLALRVSGEVGTFFFVSWRASVNAGLMVRF